VRRPLLVLAGVAMVAAGSVAPAQEGRGPAGRRAEREELFKMIDAYVVSNLQESLGITDAQFARLLPAVKRLQTARRDYVEKRRETLFEMRHLLASGAGTEPQIAELMKRLRSLEAEAPAAIQKDLDAVDAQLTPVQQAKFRLMELRVEQRLRELVRRGRGSGPRGPRPQPEDEEP
jgi:glutaredoxin 2